MSDRISYLPRAGALVLKEPADLNAHPMRKVTQQVAFDRSSWDSTRAAKVSSLFDSMASAWSEKDFHSRAIPVMDCLDRGGVGTEYWASNLVQELVHILICFASYFSNYSVLT